MSSRSSDFNYKVALASGLKSLQGGRLRQAEEQFRYLVQHFPAADGGYRGLAKVLVEQEDRPAALRVLLDGGAALAKAGDRALATTLYREAVALDAHDLTAHRRLAAALALAGENDAAAHEYVRYIRSATEAGDRARAQLEAAYALERMPENGEIAEAARAAGAPPAPRHDARAAAPPASPPAAASGGNGSWETSDGWARPAPPAQTPGLEPIAADVDAASVEATAAGYLAKGDPRGGAAALEAARRYIADGRVDAASDLLLQLIAAGIVDHEAQRLLVEVTRSLGKRDVAMAKVRLLVEALRLDGHAELAAEVEQLARAN